MMLMPLLLSLLITMMPLRYDSCFCQTFLFDAISPSYLRYATLSALKARYATILMTIIDATLRFDAATLPACCFFCLAYALRLLRCRRHAAPPSLLLID